MENKTIEINVEISEELNEDLQEYSENVGTSVNTVIINAIKGHLATALFWSNMWKTEEKETTTFWPQTDGSEGCGKGRTKA